MLTTGRRLTTASGRELTVRSLLGEGSQGTVFEAEFEGSDEHVAVKWYFPHTATEQQRLGISALVERGAPSRRFLWPIDLININAEGEFGYIMGLRTPRFAALADLLSGKVDVSFSVVARLCAALADAFLQLHSQGLCYRDISFSNIFFDPADGSPLICDNDNVGIDGRTPLSVLGTRRFMAPEIVRREAVPTSHTDLYSLSVLLFYVMMAGHPLVGRRERNFTCWDETAEAEMFGRSPLFIFDPSDPSNAPDPDLHRAVSKYWGIYPQFIRGLFVQAFTTGLRDPRDGRVRESVWRSATARLLDTIQRCDACEKENFADRANPDNRCWSCDRLLTTPSVLVVNHHRLVVSRGAKVYGHHLRHDYDLDATVGEVVAHPNRADLVGLRNDTPNDWWAWLPSGTSQVVAPGRAIRLTTGTRVDLGSGTNILVEEG